MATAQVLRVTHTVDDRVRVVEDKVLDVDERVAGIDDRVAGVDHRVVSVDDRVKAIDDKVAVVIDGAQPSLVITKGTCLTLICLKGKETRVVIQQMAKDMDQGKC
jgi:hypothetical protein